MQPANLHEYNRASIRALSPQFSTIWMEDHFQWRDRPTLEALTTIDRLQPDVVFLDVQMPGLTGFEVARRLVDGGADALREFGLKPDIVRLPRRATSSHSRIDDQQL